VELRSSTYLPILHPLPGSFGSARMLVRAFLRKAWSASPHFIHVLFACRRWSFEAPPTLPFCIICTARLAPQECSSERSCEKHGQLARLTPRLTSSPYSFLPSPHPLLHLPHDLLAFPAPTVYNSSHGLRSRCKRVPINGVTYDFIGNQ
jgi:hypothetical protein